MVRIAPVSEQDFSRYSMPRTPGDLDYQFSQRRHLIQEALDESGNTHQVDHVYEKILHRQAFLFYSPNAVLVVEPTAYPMKTVMNFWLAAGNMKELIALQEDATNFGKSVGVFEQEFRGRIGWHRLAKEHGWKKVQTLWHRNVRS